MDIEKKLLKELFAAELVEAVATAAGADPNDLFLVEPSVADYNTILRLQAEGKNDDVGVNIFAVLSCIKNGKGEKVLTTETIEALPSSTALALNAACQNTILNVFHRGMDNAKKAVDKLKWIPAKGKS